MYHPLLDQGIDPEDNDTIHCPTCHDEMEWVECQVCHGEGTAETCSACKGDGGAWECLALYCALYEPDDDISEAYTDYATFM